MRDCRRLLSVILVTAALLCLMAGCGKSDPLVGTWEAAGVKSAGEEMTLKELQDLSGLKLTAKLEFRSNGKVVGTIMDEEVNGQWTSKNGGYVLSDSGSTEMEFAISNNSFELTSSDYSIIFERVSE